MTDRTECPHCRRHIPTDMVADDFSGCPLVVKCSTPTMQPVDAWPMDFDDDDQDDGIVAPVVPQELVGA